MIDTALTEDQAILRESVERFASDHRYDRLDAGRPDPALARELGIWALPFEEQDGGLGGGAREIGIVMEAFGRNLVQTPFLSNILTAGVLVARIASQDQRRQLLPQIINGVERPVLAHAERGARFDLSHVSTSVIEEDGALVIDGGKIMVVDGADPTSFIVTARAASNDDIHAYIVPASSDGITRTAYALADGSTAVELGFDGVRVSKDRRLGGDRSVLPAVGQVLSEAALAISFEALGIAETLQQMTLEHLRTRRQFGVALGSFQAIQHEMANALVQLQCARSVVVRAAAGNDAADPARSARLRHAAKALVTRAALAIGERAVQYHGAIGITDELAVGRFLKRLHVIAAQFGDMSWNLRRFGELPVRTEDADEALSEENLRFRDEVRAFLDENLTEEIRRAMRNSPGIFIDKAVIDVWQQALLRRGWLAYTWPEEFGGPGWSPVQRYIFDRECALKNAPLLPVQGMRLLGPVLHRFGNAAQQEFYLPRILSGEHFWCQGYSEPEAGSDLASLKTRAIREGDHYVVNGTKIWTTNAHLATHIFCLVRTSTEGKSQAGISFLLIPMDSPGLSRRPIVSTSGSHDLNQVFFDNVRVPVENLVGKEGEGWTIAKFLLEHERGGSCYAPGLLVALRALRSDAATLPAGDGGSLGDDREFMSRLSFLEIEALAMEGLEIEMVAGLARGERPGFQSTVLSLLMSRITQGINRLCIEAYGYDALQLQRLRPLHDPDVPPPVGSEQARLAMPTYLNDLAWSIMGGSDEVMRNIIAKTELRL